MRVGKIIAFLLLTTEFSMLLKYGRTFYEVYKKISSKKNNFKCSESCEICNESCEKYGKCNMCDNRLCNECIFSLLREEKDE